MANIQDKVNPGDVISSDLINRIIAMLNEHDALISAGNGGGSNLITGFDPPAEQNVGKNLTVFGNFDFPLTSNNLSIDGIPIAPASFLLGSSASQLVFKVPESISVPAGGQKSVVVRIINNKGAGERNFLLRPKVAAAPDPAITSVVNNANSSSTLRIGQLAKILGRDFASPAMNNRVRLIFNDGTVNAVAYPAASGASLDIDAGSVIVPGPAQSTLLVPMPAIDNTIRDLIPINQPVAATIELTAQGASNPVKHQITITRTMP